MGKNKNIECSVVLNFIASGNWLKTSKSNRMDLFEIQSVSN